MRWVALWPVWLVRLVVSVLIGVVVAVRFAAAVAGGMLVRLQKFLTNLLESRDGRG